MSDSGETAPVRAFVSVRSEEEPGQRGRFERIDDVLADPEKRRQLVMRCLERLQALQQAYANLTEFSDIFTAVDSLDAVALGAAAEREARRAARSIRATLQRAARVVEAQE